MRVLLFWLTSVSSALARTRARPGSYIAFGIAYVRFVEYRKRRRGRSGGLAGLGIVAPRAVFPARTGSVGTCSVSADRSETRAGLATAAPRETAETLVARAGSRGSTILALGIHVFLFFHAEQTLLFFDPLAVDTAAAHGAVHTKSTTGAAHARRGGDARHSRVKARLLGRT